MEINSTLPQLTAGNLDQPKTNKGFDLLVENVTSEAVKSDSSKTLQAYTPPDTFNPPKEPHMPTT